jgi:hypothetical protein
MGGVSKARPKLGAEVSVKKASMKKNQPKKASLAALTASAVGAPASDSTFAHHAFVRDPTMYEFSIFLFKLR